jgi:ATP-dependent exoDNAse (exonuclease V) alpha subunit
MAIYRLAADIVRRSEGRTVTAAAAYRSAELIVDQRTGLAFDYRRRHGVLDTEILAPNDAPGWMHDRVRLWNAVEAAEKRKDAQLARDIELALPHELTAGEHRELVHRFVRSAFVDAGMVADIALHAPDEDGDTRNFHAHILLTMRRIEGDHFGDKERAWNKPEQLEQWRALWADHVNQALEIAGDQACVDHRSLEAQGIERLPQIHLGLAVTEMRRRGITTERAELAGAIATLNTRIGFRSAAAKVMKADQVCTLFFQAASRITAWAVSFWQAYRPGRAAPSPLTNVRL